MRCVLATAIVAALVLAGTAAADGDPASDYLLGQNTYLPTPPPPPSAAAALNQAVAEVWASGDQIKVAVIATPQDLGSVTSLFGEPTQYAKFLAIEIGFLYTGPVLVVMPAGFGFYTGTGAPYEPAGQHVTGSTAADLTTSAAAAVSALERAGALHVKDRTKPTASVLPQHGRAGKALLLRYQARDDSGRVSVTLTISRGTHAVATLHAPSRPVIAGRSYGLPWRIPKSLAHASLTLCARATDGAGNRSIPACASLSIS